MLYEARGQVELSRRTARTADMTHACGPSLIADHPSLGIVPPFEFVDILGLSGHIVGAWSAQHDSGDKEKFEELSACSHRSSTKSLMLTPRRPCRQHFARNCSGDPSLRTLSASVRVRDPTKNKYQLFHAPGVIC